MTTPYKTLFINFQAQQIGLYGPQALVRDVARRFQAMLTVSPQNVAGWVRVRTAPDAILIDVEWRQESIVAPSHSDAVQTIEHEIALWFMRLQSEYYWLHAGAASWQNQGVLFLGEWGQGKSSLVTELSRKNWCYCSDDLIPWRPADNRILAFPQTPRVRRPVSEMLPRTQVNQLSRQTIPLKPNGTCTDDMPVCGVINLQFEAHSETRLTPMPPAQAVLAMTRALLNQERHRETAVSHFVTLFSQIPAYQLTYSDRKMAAALVAQQFAKPTNSHSITLPPSNLATRQP